jgi:ABC-2 type transport system permease protein
MLTFIHDTRILFANHLRETVRMPAYMIIGLFQPICYLFLFSPLLDRLMSGPGFASAQNTATFFVPGLMIMQAIFGSAYAGMGIIADTRNGVLERLRVTPVNRLSMLLSMVLRDAVILLIQCGLLLVFALIKGLQADLVGLLLIGLLLLLVGTASAAASYALALTMRNESALVSSVNLLVVPLFLLSGVTLPLSLAPQSLQNIARFNPFAHAVDASRALMAGSLTDGSLVPAFLIFGGLMILTLWWATHTIRTMVA